MDTLLLIQKKKFWGTGTGFSGRSFGRWYSVGKATIEGQGLIKTEAQLCLFLKRKYGVGRFMVTAIRKGRKGLFVFWLGEIYKDGFTRDKKNSQWIESIETPYDSENYEDEEGYNSRKEKYIGHKQNSYRHKKRGPDCLEPSQPVGNNHSYQEYLRDEPSF